SSYFLLRTSKVPELPEVETIIRDLNKKVLHRTFIDVWTDFPKTVRKLEDFEQFKKNIKGKKIQKIWRRGKNIIFNLSENCSLLIHQKLTGHLLLGKWEFKEGKWIPPAGPLAEKINAYIHLLFTLDNGQMLALSDLRKFAKVELWDNEGLKKELGSFGPEPLEKDFTFEKFQECLSKKRKGKIKQVLMDQTVIAGIGNIYSDEILWESKMNPLREVSKLSRFDIDRIYQAMQKILRKAIKLGGESISDFRRISGEKGYFDKERKVYRREGEPCPRCSTKIKRTKLGGRNAHYCPNCQIC
ncbi:DNA-formamidopyrimidine glycosylase, partial [Patescibacteria group bacterium]|nr:DNA-formamidopyrimidine glycosylase [Patescibacteria group bacterium]